MNLLDLLSKNKASLYWSIQSVRKLNGTHVCYILETEDLKDGDHTVYSFNESDQTFIAEGGAGGFGDDEPALEMYSEFIEMVIRTITGLKEFETEVICNNNT